MNESTQKSIFRLGDVLNNTYRIEAALGRGGTSEVYRARSEISGRVMAIKALRLEFSRNEDYLALMTREEDMREIRHDAIVRYYDNQRTDDGHVYLVMDYVEGPGLDKVLKDGGMSADDLYMVAERITEGLVAAHAKNIVHRDLSPDNIILRDGDPREAVIIDFGIAKDSNPGAETIIGNEFAGKYAYAAPEQLNGQTDARADIYSLGALLLSTFRGAPPDIGNNPMEVIKKKGEPLDTEGVPQPLKSLIEQMTHPDREKRLQSADAVLNVIRNGAFANYEDDGDKTVIAPRPQKAAEVEAPIGIPTPKTVPEKAKKSGGLVPILGALVLIGGGAGVYFSGLLDSKLPVADPYSLLLEVKENGTAQALGHVPNADIQAALNQIIVDLGGVADLELSTGSITETWGADILSLTKTLSDLDAWELLASNNTVRMTGITNDRTLHREVTNALSGDGIPLGLTGNVLIDLGPRILTASSLVPIINQHSDCGEINIIGAPAIGYGMGEQVTVSGRFAEVASRVALVDALNEVIGDRELILDAEMLNPTLCLIDAALPDAPEGGFEITFGFGDKAEENLSGRFFVGENPTIDITIPRDITDGLLFVSALDVSGNVFHLLPNLKDESNDIAKLRAGQEGPLTIRVAHSIAEAADGSKLAFVVDDTSLGKTKILVIHSDGQVFDGLRPTTESAGGYAAALETRTAFVQSLDSRILTSQKKP